MEFMSDEEFNRVMDDFDWDAPIAPINKTQNQQEPANSSSKSLAEAAQGLPLAVTSDSSYRPSTLESMETVKSPEILFGSPGSTDHTKREPAYETYVLPAEIYYDPKQSLFWDERDFRWARPPRVATLRRLGLHQEQTLPHASSPKEGLDGSSKEIHATREETTPSTDTIAPNGPIDPESNRTGLTESESHRTKCTVSGDNGPSTPNPSRLFSPINVHSSTNCQEASSEILTQQDKEINIDVAVSEDPPNATAQGTDITTNASVSEAHTNAIGQYNETITDVPASNDHASAIQPGDGIITDVAFSKDLEGAIDKVSRVLTNLSASKGHVNCDKQGDVITTNVFVSEDYEGTIDQRSGHGRHEAAASGITVPKDSTKILGIERTSIVDSTESRPMARALERPQRLFSSAVSLSSFPVRRGIKTRQSVDPFTSLSLPQLIPASNDYHGGHVGQKRHDDDGRSAQAMQSAQQSWQPFNSEYVSDISESPTSIPQDIGLSSNIGETIETAPSTGTLSTKTPMSNLTGTPGSASEAQSLSAPKASTLRGTSADSPEGARSTHSQPPMSIARSANEIGEFLEVPYEPQSTSAVIASTLAESPPNPMEAIDMTPASLTKAASADTGNPNRETENLHEQQSSCDQKTCSTEGHCVNPDYVVDLTQVSSSSDASTPTADSSHSPEAFHEALPSLTTNVHEAKSSSDSVSDTDMEPPKEALHDTPASFAPVSFANSPAFVDSPEAVRAENSSPGGNSVHSVSPQTVVRRTQSSFVKFVCIPTEEPISSLEAAEAKKVQDSPVAEASIPVHNHVKPIRASQEGQALPPPDTYTHTEKHAERLEAAHEHSQALTTMSIMPAEESGAPLEAVKKIQEHPNDADKEVPLVETKTSTELSRSSYPQHKVQVPGLVQTLTPPTSRRSSLRGETTLKNSLQEPAMTKKMDAKVGKLDCAAPQATPKSKSRARKSSPSNRRTRSNTSTHTNFPTIATRTAALPDEDSALQVEQAKALPQGDDIPPSTQQHAAGKETLLVGLNKASQATELSSEYHDELAMSDPEDPHSMPSAVRLTPHLKRQVRTPKSSPSIKSRRRPKDALSIDRELSAKVTKRAKTERQGRRLVGNRELGGLLMREDDLDGRARTSEGGESAKAMTPTLDDAEKEDGKVTKETPSKTAIEVTPKHAPLRKRGRNKSLDMSHDGKVVEKKPRRSGRLSEGLDVTEQAKAMEKKPRRSGRLSDGASKPTQDGV